MIRQLSVILVFFALLPCSPLGSQQRLPRKDVPPTLPKLHIPNALADLRAKGSLKGLDNSALALTPQVKLLVLILRPDGTVASADTGKPMFFPQDQQVIPGGGKPVTIADLSSILGKSVVKPQPVPGAHPSDWAADPAATKRIADKLWNVIERMASGHPQKLKDEEALEKYAMAKQPWKSMSETGKLLKKIDLRVDLINHLVGKK